MTPKGSPPVVDPLNMALKLRARKRSMDKCAHRNVMTLEIAGMRREVCESCGRIGLANVVRHSPVIEIQESSSVTVRLADSEDD